ncbi:hypothetical protein PSYMO_38458, partial [Pseudomonas amygdali pv. mori str. 301020]
TNAIAEPISTAPPGKTTQQLPVGLQAPRDRRDP